MATLSDTQLVILSAACGREDRLVLPLPTTLKGGAANKVVGSLLAKDLIKEAKARRGDIAWRQTDEGQRLTLLVTDAAFAALQIDPEPSRVAVATPLPRVGQAKRATNTRKLSGHSAPTEDAASKARAGSKQAMVIAMLEGKQGATIEEIATATGWQSHTVRGALAGALKKRLGLNVVSAKDAERGRIYRIA